MKRNIAIIVFLVLTAIGYYLYRQLGGNPPLEFTTTTQSFTVYGEDFSGSYNSSLVENIFLRAKELSSSTNSYLTVVNYGSDEEAKLIEQFIGIWKPDEKNSTIPEGYTVKNFESTTLILTSINTHNSVMPKPEEVREQAIKFGSENGLLLTNITIEVYKSDRELNVYFLCE